MNKEEEEKRYQNWHCEITRKAKSLNRKIYFLSKKKLWTKMKMLSGEWSKRLIIIKLN